MPDDYTCTTSWYDNTNVNSGTSHDQVIEGEKCTKKNRLKDNQNYWVDGEDVYWVYYKKETSDANCYGGGVGNLGQVFSPICWTPKSWHRLRVDETRKYWLISRDASNFRSVASPQNELTDKQKNKFDRYRIDSNSAYFDSRKILGSHPESFEVVFPFESNMELNSYSFSKDKSNAYVNAHVFPVSNFEGIKWLDLPCKSEGFYGCDKDKSNKPHIGMIDNDMIYLDDASEVTMFKNFAKNFSSCSIFNGVLRCAKNGNAFEANYDFHKKVFLMMPVKN